MDNSGTGNRSMASRTLTGEARAWVNRRLLMLFFAGSGMSSRRRTVMKSGHVRLLAACVLARRVRGLMGVQNGTATVLRALGSQHAGGERATLDERGTTVPGGFAKGLLRLGLLGTILKLVFAGGHFLEGVPGRDGA